ncbi:sulfur carrier protein ThiS [Colwellia sp. MSW7]|jgi:sulfur carrier protein|uniref:Sulfur carrier protein ThiS n=1 Tax=Colwellia maritima TaxID=2912588 RepID=A0ABS9WW85_9GAMM|nr:sulfur carrier protein ThiS [Colwellia maritima]MCI2282158.1 sulfur carrier protein ThiS [Colwellia maritima]
MNIHINGKAYSLPHEVSITVTAALTLHFIESQQSTFAVALNGDFVGKTDYDTTIVNNGDSLDVLQPIQGG